MLALVDCNSFYASCELVFRPDLRGRPVVVLSNNDGCIVARNGPAKLLDIPSFTPYFKISHKLREQGVSVFSSNYALYGDLSQRVMTCLREFSPDVEIYSIDEAFLSLHGLQIEPSLYGRTIRQKVWRNVRVPVSVGIAPSKTLAKVANNLAKKERELAGVFHLQPSMREYAPALRRFPVQDVWGIGRRLATRLQAQGVVTAWDLVRQPPSLLRKQFGVNMERTIRELAGEPCVALDEQPQPKQQIYCTRSFGERIYTLQGLQEAVSSYATRALEKLRRQDALTSAVQLFIQTGRHDQLPYSRSILLPMPYPTNDTRIVVQQLRHALPRLFKPGLPYYKAGVGLLDLRSAAHQQLDLLTPRQSSRSYRLMSALDQINQRMPGSVFLASNGINQGWQMRQQLKSPSYTTRWDQLPVVK